MHSIHLHPVTQFHIARFLLIVYALLRPLISYTDNVIVFSDKQRLTCLQNGMSILADSPYTSLEEVISKKFIPYPDGSVPVLGIGNHWVKFRLENVTDVTTLFFKIDNSFFDEIDFYVVMPDSTVHARKSGGIYKFSERKYRHQKIIFEFNLPPGEVVTCYLRARSREEVLLPCCIGTLDKMAWSLNFPDMLFSIYIGVFLSMISYNIFIFWSIRDKVYLLYVGYMFFLALSQLHLFGFLGRFILPEHPALAYWTFIIATPMSGLLAVLFVQNFLGLKNFSAKLHAGLNIVAFMWGLSIIVQLTGFSSFRNLLWDITGTIGSLLFFAAVFVGIRKGHRTAVFLGISWSVFFLGYLLFILSVDGVLPFSTFTGYALPVGSSIEAIMLSFALADRIRILRKDNEAKKNEIIIYLKANEEYLQISRDLAIDAERLKKEVLLTEFESLKNQVNPHFLFNSLNVLTDLVYEAQEEAVRFINELANIYRYVLDCKEKEVIELSAELEFIRSYIFLLKIRFEDNLNVTINIPDPSRLLIAPVTLQLLVENAIKHNIVSMEYPLNISIYLEKDYLVVHNNIQLRRRHEKSTEVGLKNIALRYKFLSGKEMKVFNDGTNFTVWIPVVRFKDASNSVPV